MIKRFYALPPPCICHGSNQRVCNGSIAGILCYPTLKRKGLIVVGLKFKVSICLNELDKLSDQINKTKI